MSGRAFFLSAALLWGGTAAAQSIEVGELGEAEVFSAGVLDVASGGLDANAWSGTSAPLATRLLQTLPTEIEHPIARDLVAAALLSGAVPPEGTEAERKAFADARTAYLLASGQSERVAALLERDVALSRDRRAQTDLALDRGDVESACLSAEDVVEGRADPYWAKLRAFCLAQADQVAAAELTVELLANFGHEDMAFARLFDGLTKNRRVRDVEPRTALHRAMVRALGVTAGSGDELGSLLSRMDTVPADQFGAAMRALAGEAVLTTGAELADNSSERATAALYVLATEARDANALAEFLRRAEGKGFFAQAATALADALRSSPPAPGAEGLWVKAAVLRGDIGALVGLHGGAGGEAAARIALVSDALGGGFRFAPLGEDIDARLERGDARAVRDALMAMALGGRASDTALAALESATYPDSTAAPGALVTLRASGVEGARAETALRAARLIADGKTDMLTLAEVISSLDAAGLNSFANRVAAWDMAAPLSGD